MVEPRYEGRLSKTGRGLGETGRKKSKALKDKGKGRVCQHEGCDTILSRYNPEETCDPHTPRYVPAYLRIYGESGRVRHLVTKTETMPGEATPPIVDKE